MSATQQISSFILLRHALSEANRDGIVQGQSDYPLAQEGIKDVLALIEFWDAEERSFDRLISSPLQRAKGTAELIADRFEIALEFDDIWKERHYGEAENITYERARELLANNPFTSPFEPLFKTGESEWDLHIRASKAVQNLLLLGPGNFLIVSHGGFLGAVLRAILGIAPSYSTSRQFRFSFENTGYAEIRFHHHEVRWHIEKLNSTLHLIQPGD